ncbi:MAG: YajG family lipoprotein [Patescibacteria group bacterium]
MRKTACFIFLSFLVSGCAYISQNLKVEPSANILSSQVGAGKKIGLCVVDEREDRIIGNRSNVYGMKTAKITTDQDVPEILQTAMSDGLRKKGFLPVAKDESATSMKVELRVLAYDVEMGFWTGGNIGKSTIKIVATNAAGQTYEKMYHGQREIRTCFLGSQETNAKVVNCAFSAAIENIFNDKDLIDFLVKEEK